MSEPASTIWRPPKLESERLILRPVEEMDANAIFTYASNPNMTRFTLWEPHRSLHDSLSFIRDYAQANYLQKVPDPMGICLKHEPDVVIGTLGIHWAKRSNHCMELGFALGERHWGQGIIVEAARTLLDYGFVAYDVERVQAHCFAENAASARVMEKLGMTFEGTLRSALRHRNRYWNLHMYSVIRREWRAKQS